RRAADDVYAEGRGEQRRGKQRALFAVVAFHEEVGEPRPGGGAQRRGQAERPFPRAEERDARRLQPVDQDRLVIARLAVEVRREEIAALKHLQRRLAEGGF